MTGHLFKCLVVEDEAEIRELMALILVREGYQVQTLATGDQALTWLQGNHCDLLLVDWMLPGDLSGVDLIKQLRQSGFEMPILMVTAKTQPEDVVLGLDAGADDYVTKPFETAVLRARIAALLRRTNQPKPPVEAEVLSLGKIQINVASHECFVNSEMIHLTPSEFKILQEMLSNVGRVLTREFLMGRVQGEGIVVTGRTIDTHVFALRKKLGAEADHVETIRGVGYRIKHLA